MSPGKIASQAVHAAIGLGVTDPNISVIVLKVGEKAFNSFKEELNCYVVQDLGYTEVEPGTETTLAYLEE